MIKLGKHNFKEEYPAYVLNPDDYQVTPWAEEKIRQLEQTVDIIRIYISRTRCIPRIQEACDVTAHKAGLLYVEAQKMYALAEDKRGSQQFWVDILLAKVIDLMAEAALEGDIKSRVKLLDLLKKIIAEFFGGHAADAYTNIQLPDFVLTAVPKGVAELPDNWKEKAKHLLGDNEKILELLSEHEVDEAIIIQEQENDE